MRAHRSNRSRGREGAIVAIVLVVLVMVSLAAASLLRVATADGVEAGKQIASARAFWAAEAGMERAKSIAQKRRRPFPLISIGGVTIWGTNVLSGTIGGATFSVDVVDDPAWTNATQLVKKYIIRARGTAGGITQTVSVKAQIESFANYMHASNHERSSDGTRIHFGSGDVIDGPVYVNDQLNLFGTPTFLQTVRSASNSVNYVGGATAASFQGGLILNAPPLDFTGQFSSDHIQGVRSEAESGGVALHGANAGNYQFDFNADGTVRYYRLSGGPTNTASLSMINGAIYVDGDAWVNGTVNGQVTLAAQRGIFISNQITYASASGANPNPWQTNFNAAAVTDKIGLMASNQVQIVGTNAVTIHAAVLVTSDGGGFNASNRFVNIGQPNINLFGSLAQFRRGIVGRSNGDGFLKNYKFDPRFNFDAPPNFPYSAYTYRDWRQSSQ